MTHDKIIQLRARTACQCCSGIAQAIRLCREGGSSTGIPIRYLQAPGLSLCAGSTGDRQRGSDSGEKDSFYGQAITEPNPGTSAMCQVHRAKLKRDSDRGSGGVSQQGSGAWLERRTPLKRFSWNIALTDCQLKRLPKPTNFWCPRGSGLRVIETNV